MLPDIFSPELAVAAGLAALAGLLRGFTGFGSAMLLAPSLSALYGPVTGIATLAVIELVVTLQLLPGAIRIADWPTVGWIGPVSALTVPLGVALLAASDPEIVRLVITGVILLFVTLLAAGFRHGGRVGRLGLMGVGGLSGISTGLTGMGGPPLVLFLLGGPHRAASVRSSLILIFAVGDGALLASLAWRGALPPPVLLQAGLLLPPFLLAAWAGSRGFDRSSESLYRNVALALVVLVAVASLLF